MDELAAKRTFLQVVEQGSFSAAARAMKVSVGSVSRQIVNLESMLGTRLINRTTRHLRLTEAGEIYAQRVRAVLLDIENANREVAGFREGARGVLKVHLRITSANHFILSALPRFLDMNPTVKIDVTLTDERIDLVAGGIDVAVWLGHLGDSSLIARRLYPGSGILCASPSYIARHGTPRTPNDLLNHNCVVYRAAEFDNRWRLTKDGQTVTIKISGNVITDSTMVLQSCALGGVGIVATQAAVANEALRKGELVRVLPDYAAIATPRETDVFVVYPSQHYMAPATRAFIDFLVELFSDPALTALPDPI